MDLFSDIISWIKTHSIFGNLISSIFIGFLALWQGISIIADKKLDRLKLLNEKEIKKSWWYKLKSLDGVILFIIIIGFVIGCIFQYFYILNQSSLK
jgi:hypothetical protein